MPGYDYVFMVFLFFSRVCPLYGAHEKNLRKFACTGPPAKLAYTYLLFITCMRLAQVNVQGHLHEIFANIFSALCALFAYVNVN